MVGYRCANKHFVNCDASTQPPREFILLQHNKARPPGCVCSRCFIRNKWRHLKKGLTASQQRTRNSARTPTAPKIDEVRMAKCWNVKAVGLVNPLLFIPHLYSTYKYWFRTTEITLLRIKRADDHKQWVDKELELEGRGIFMYPSIPLEKSEGSYEKRQSVNLSEIQTGHLLNTSLRRYHYTNMFGEFNEFWYLGGRRFTLKFVEGTELCFGP